MPDSGLPTTDSPPAARQCDPTSALGAPVLVAGFGTADDEQVARLSPDELTMYISGRFGGPVWDIYQASRASPTDPFGMPTKLAGGVNSAGPDFDPSPSADGLALYFGSTRVAGEGNHIYVATRSSLDGVFGTASLVANIGSATVTDNDGQPFVTADGKEMWFTSTRAGGAGGMDIYRARRTGTAFEAAVAVPELASSADEWLPVVSADGLTIYFSSRREPSEDMDIWMSHRSVATDGFPTPSLVAHVNSPSDDHPTWISPDNCRLYLFSGRAGTSDLYVATRTPM